MDFMTTTHRAMTNLRERVLSQALTNVEREAQQLAREARGDTTPLDAIERREARLRKTMAVLAKVRKRGGK